MDAFPEAEHAKYMVRLITNEMVIDLPGKGKVKVSPKKPNNLFSIEFKGLSTPKILSGQYTTLKAASEAVRKYLDENKIEFGEVERYASMGDRGLF